MISKYLWEYYSHAGKMLGRYTGPPRVRESESQSKLMIDPSTC